MGRRTGEQNMTLGFPGSACTAGARTSGQRLQGRSAAEMHRMSQDVSEQSSIRWGGGHEQILELVRRCVIAHVRENVCACEAFVRVQVRV